MHKLNEAINIYIRRENMAMSEMEFVHTQNYPFSKYAQSK